MGINALRSNPNLIGYGMTGCNDPLEFGEGAFTAFRELKPLDQFEWSFNPSLPKKQVFDLATCRFIEEKHLGSSHQRPGKLNQALISERQRCWGDIA